MTAQPFAHRGLHGDGRVENSRAAFAAALDAGQGIELDVRLSRCGSAIVFHDERLDRLCDVAHALADLDRAELSEIRLRNSEEAISSLAEVLDLVAGRVPLLVEIKSVGAAYPRLCAAVRADLAGYAGPAAIMSFDPRVLRWFRLHAPGIIRGLVVSEAGKKFSGIAERHLAVASGKPDFIAYDIASLPSGFAARARRSGHLLLTWTVRTPADAARARLHADQIIHELAGSR